MSALTIEQRLVKLEARVMELQNELRAVKRPAKDRRRSIGAFTDDTGMQEILREAMRLREADRKKARAKNPIKRKSSR